MNYLFDTNALLALGFQAHEFHARVARWLASASRAGILTCAITELGFVRVLAQAPVYGLTMEHARALLGQLRGNRVIPVRFVGDDQDVSALPEWVRAAKQLTDGHLWQLAQAHGAALATLDERIPGAFLIPRL